MAPPSNGPTKSGNCSGGWAGKNQGTGSGPLHFSNFTLANARSLKQQQEGESDQYTRGEGRYVHKTSYELEAEMLRLIASGREPTCEKAP